MSDNHRCSGRASRSGRGNSHESAYRERQAIGGTTGLCSDSINLKPKLEKTIVPFSNFEISESQQQLFYLYYSWLSCQRS